MKNLGNKGLSLVELLVSFSLSFVVLIYLFNIIMMVKNLYLVSDEKTNIMIKQATMIKKIENKLSNLNIDSVNTCGSNCIRFNYGEDSSDLIVDAPNRTIIFDNFKMKFMEGTKLGNISVSKKEIIGIDTSIKENNDGIVTFNVPIKHVLLDGEYGIRYTFMYNSSYTHIPDIRPEDFISVTIKGNVESGKAVNKNVVLTANVKPKTPFNKYKYRWQKKENGNWIDVANTDNNTLNVSEEGKKDYRVIVTDTNGNTAISNNYNIFIDKTPPIFTKKNNSSNGNWTKNSVTISVEATDSASGMNKIEYSYDKNSFYNDWASKTPSSASDTWSAERNNVLYVRATDNAGNIAYYETAIRIDKTAPTFTSKYNSSNGNWTNGNVDISAAATDSASGMNRIEYSYDNSTYHSDWTVKNPGSVSSTWGAERNNKLYIKATDNAGNSTYYETAIRIDKTAPTCQVNFSGTVGTNGWYRKSNVSVSLSRNDASSGIKQYGLDNSSGESYNGRASGTQSSNTSQTYWYGHVKDNAGNKASCYRAVKLDKNYPSFDSITSKYHPNGIPGSPGYYLEVFAKFSDSGPSGIAATRAYNHCYIGASPSCSGLKFNTNSAYPPSYERNDRINSHLTYSMVKATAHTYHKVCDNAGNCYHYNVKTVWNRGPATFTRIATAAN